MGHIFDIHLAKAYESWSRSPKGLRLEYFVERMISETLRPFKKERVLDIGCGAGNHLLYANKLGMDITGIDASPYMLDIARSRLGNKCELKKAYAEDLPFEDNAFDVVFLINTLEFSNDPLSAIKEAGRVANREIFLVFFNSMSRYCRWQKFRGIFTDNLFSYIRPYSLWSIKNIIKKAYGQVPIRWKSECLMPFKHFEIPFCPINYLPFGYIIGISITLKYNYKTDNLFIKEKLGRSKNPVVEGIPISNSR